MPSEDLVYRVNLDPSQLTAQLEDLKSKVDLAMGGAFSSIGDNVFNGSSNFSDSLVNTLSKGWENVAEVGRLGYHKFREEAELSRLSHNDTLPQVIGRDSGISFSNVSGPTSFYNMQEEMADAGIAHRLSARYFGYGWDPKAPMSRREYSNLAIDEISPEAMGRSMASIANFGLSTAIGTAVGVGTASPILGIAADMASSMLLEKPLNFLFGPEEEERIRYQRAAYFKNESRAGQRLSMSKGEATNIAGSISEYMTSHDRFLSGYDEKEMNSMLSVFDQAGGLDNTTTAREYQTKLKEFIANHREVMHILRMSSDEAASFMGEMNSMGLNSLGTAAGIAAGLKSTGAYLGYTPAESMSMIQRGGELVRGSGINMAGAGLDLLGNTGMVQTMNLGGVMTAEQIRQAGGKEQMAALMLKSGYNYAQSVPGQVTMLAGMGSGGLTSAIGMSPSDRIGAAYSQLDGVSDLLSFWGSTEDLASEYGSDVMNRAQATDYVRFLSQGLGKKVTKRELRGFLKNRGMGATEIDMMTSYAFQSSEDITNAAEDQFERSERMLMLQRPTKMMEVGASVKRGVDRTLEFFGDSIVNTLTLNLGTEEGREAWKGGLGGTAIEKNLSEFSHDLKYWNSGVTLDELRDIKLDKSLLDPTAKIVTEDTRWNKKVKALWNADKITDKDKEVVDAIEIPASISAILDPMKKMQALESHIQSGDQTMSEDVISKYAAYLAVNDDASNPVYMREKIRKDLRLNDRSDDIEDLIQEKRDVRFNLKKSLKETWSNGRGSLLAKSPFNMRTDNLTEIKGYSEDELIDKIIGGKADAFDDALKYVANNFDSEDPRGAVILSQIKKGQDLLSLKSTSPAVVDVQHIRQIINETAGIKLVDYSNLNLDESEDADVLRRQEKRSKQSAKVQEKTEAYVEKNPKDMTDKERKEYSEARSSTDMQSLVSKIEELINELRGTNRYKPERF